MRRCLLAFEPPDGGVAENVLRLALGLTEHGWDPYVAGPREAVVYPQLAAAGVPVARLPLRRGYGHPGSDLRALRGLAALLRRHSFDVVHVHSAKAGVLGRLAARGTGTPAVYSPHCFPFVGPWGFPRRQVSIAVEFALGWLARRIVCVAHEERRLAIELRIATEERLVVIHNGTEPCSTRHGADPALAAFAAGGPLAACIAVLRPQKAVDVFVDAAPAILEACPRARLAVVGNGELRAELEGRAARLGLDERLRFFDFTPPAARYLESIDVFVLPSAWEALPISVLEAMSCGVPQVATSVGGTAEAVVDGATGLLCPPGRPDLLAERVAALLGDEGRRTRMGHAARELHARSFSSERMVAETARTYELAARAG